MPKYLRFIADHFTDADGRPDEHLSAAWRQAPEVWHLGWMYEHYATPMRANGVAKVNVFFTAAEVDRAPDEVLSIASVYETFDAEHFLSLPPPGRKKYYLDRLHAAMTRCAATFGWELRSLTDAYQRILDEDYQFSFLWKKPLASPDRRMKVQALVEASPFPVRLYVVLFDRQMNEMRRTLLSVGTNGRGAVEFALGEIGWVDANTVKILTTNSRDYWLCTTDGQLDFHYPRADDGDPHGEYDLGRLYYDGELVLQDRERGLKLIRAAASKGFKHAIRFLAQLENRRGERP